MARPNGPRGPDIWSLNVVEEDWLWQWKYNLITSYVFCVHGLATTTALNLIRPFISHHH